MAGGGEKEKEKWEGGEGGGEGPRFVVFSSPAKTFRRASFEGCDKNMSTKKSHFIS